MPALALYIFALNHQHSSVCLKFGQDILYFGFSRASVAFASVRKGCKKYGMSPWWPLLELPNTYAIIQLSHSNSSAYRKPIDFIYGYLIFKWVAVTRMRGYKDYNASHGHQVIWRIVCFLIMRVFICTYVCMVIEGWHHVYKVRFWMCILCK